jgi:hypothetical protein
LGILGPLLLPEFPGVPVLPQNQCEVAVEHRHAVRIAASVRAPADTVWLSPMPLWCSRLLVEHRLQFFLDAASERVQKFVSRRYKPMADDDG